MREFKFTNWSVPALRTQSYEADMLIRKSCGHLCYSLDSLPCCVCMERDLYELCLLHAHCAIKKGALWVD